MTLPLSGFRMIATDDPAEALHSMQQRQPCCQAITPLVPRDWKLVSNAYLMDDVSLVASLSQGYSVEVHPDHRIRIFMPLAGDMSLRFNGQDFTQLGRSEAFFLNHGFGLSTFHPGNALVLLTTSAHSVAEYLRLLECDLDPSEVADRLAGDPNAPGLSALRRAVMHCIWSIEQGFPDFASHALFRQQNRQSLLLQVASLIAKLAASGQQRVSAHARTLRRAIDYITMTPPDAFSYADLARHVGASLRSVQLAFRAELGVTIREWLRDYRLDGAREVLRAGGPGSSVAAVALQFGFSHPGRFSAAYQARFGEYPSETALQSRHG